MIDDNLKTRYAYTQEGRLCHAEAIGKTQAIFRCAVCSDDVQVVRAANGVAYFQHCTDTTCSGRFSCELAPDLIAELGDKPWWISFDADWQATGWTVRTVRLTWTGEGYLPDADAERWGSKIRLTGTHAFDPTAAIESVRALLDDLPRRLINRAETGGHFDSP